MSTATVVLVAATSPGPELRDLVGTWTTAGLLRRSFWVVTDGDFFSDPHHDRCSATVLDMHNPREVDLLRALAPEPYQLVRLVCVHLLTTEGSCAAALTDHARRLSELIQANAPSSAQIIRINMVVPATSVPSVPRDCLIDGWSANVLASPEDRASQTYFNVLVEHPGNFLGHAALHCATVGGLWGGTTEGPFDVPTPSPGLDPLLTAARCFARVVHGAPVVDALASRLLVERKEWALPSGLSHQPTTVAHAAKTIGEFVAGCGHLDSEAFIFHPAIRPREDEPQPIGVLEAFRQLFKFLGGRVRQWPIEAWRRKVDDGKEFIERVAQEKTFGGGSRFVVRIGGVVNDRPGQERRAGVDASSADPVLAVLTDPPFVAPTPGIWQAIRRLCLGLVDGSSLPDEFTTPMEGPHREIFTDPSLIAPDPVDPPYEIPADVARGLSSTADTDESFVIGPCDPYTARLVLEELDALSDRLNTSAGESPPITPSAGVSRTEPSADTAEPTERSEPRTQSTREESNQNDRVPDDGEYVSRVRGVRSSLAEWCNARSNSLLWQLGARLGGELKRANAALDEALAFLGQVEDPGTGASDIAARRHKFARLMVIIAGCAAAALFLGILVGALVVGALFALTIGILVVLAYFCVSFAAYVAHEHEMFRLAHRLWQRCSDAEFARRRAMQAAIELNRLVPLYEQLVDWAEILGWVGHHPWGQATAVSGLAATQDIDSSSLPCALGIALAEAPEEKLAVVATGYSASLFVRGWLNELYDGVRDHAMSKLREMKGLGEREPLPDPDVDIPRVPNGARTYLRDALARGTAQRAAYDAAVSGIADFCRTQEPETLFDTVEPLARPVVEPDQPDGMADYLARALPAGAGDPLDQALWSQEGLTSEDRGWHVYSTTGWVPPFYRHDPRFSDSQVTELHDAAVDVRPGEAYVLRAIRIDFSGACPLGDFRVGTTGARRGRDGARRPAAPKTEPRHRDTDVDLRDIR